MISSIRCPLANSPQEGYVGLSAQRSSRRRQRCSGASLNTKSNCRGSSQAVPKCCGFDHRGMRPVSGVERWLSIASYTRGQNVESRVLAELDRCVESPGSAGIRRLCPADLRSRFTRIDGSKEYLRSLYKKAYDQTHASRVKTCRIHFPHMRSRQFELSNPFG